MTTWQDLVFTAGSIVLTLGLIPTVMHWSKPPLRTSIPTATVLTVFVFVYISLGLLFSATTTAVTSLLWWVIAFQKWLGHRWYVVKGPESIENNYEITEDDRNIPYWMDDPDFDWNEYWWQMYDIQRTLDEQS